MCIHVWQFILSFRHRDKIKKYHQKSHNRIGIVCVFFIQINENFVETCIIKSPFISDYSEKNVASYLISSCIINKAEEAREKNLSLFYLLKKK